MQYNRILVLGCCGSGKTTFAFRLGEITGLPIVHLDRLWWKPGWIESTREDFDARLTDALVQEKWIIDGNFERTLPLRLQYCDQVIYFELPRLVCLYGVLRRVMKFHGKTRPDMGDGCPERFDWDFIRYVWNFEKTQGARNKEHVQSSGVPTVIFRSRRAVREYLRECAYDQT